MAEGVVRAYVLAARPKTLPAAAAPVACGAALSWNLTGHCSAWLLACTLLSALAIQVATNYFNDAIDAGKGADTGNRLGPVRATAGGMVSGRAMVLAGVTAALAALAFSLPLVAARGWPIVAIGVVSLFFTWGYTGGPWPLAYRGLGELFVLLFFGFVAVAGTVFVLSGEWRAEALLAGLQTGMLSTVLIAINNLRDIAEDTGSGKRTLAVRFGVRFAKSEIAALCLLPEVAGAGWFLLGRPALAVWPSAALILGVVVAGKVLRTPPSRAYNRYLALAAGHLVLWTGLFVAAALPA